MLRNLAEKFIRATTAQSVSARWSRRKGDYLVKTARLTDGEILHLLLGKSPERESAEDDQFYKSLQSIRAHTLKSAMWLVVSGSFGVLAHFNGLQGASSNGLSVSPAVFNHAALLSLSASFSWFCFNYCKQSYIQSWFAAKIRNGSPQLRAILLLKYPEAYFHFAFLPASIGLPKNVFSRKLGYDQLFAIILVIIALLAFAGGSWVLWLTIAIDVWRSNKISNLGTLTILSLSTALILLGLTAPFRRDGAKQYKHHGLISQLTKLRGDELQHAHVKIYLAARRMDLLNSKEDS